MGEENKLLAICVSLGVVVVLIIAAAIMAYILHRRAKKKLKRAQRRRESATILENFMSIEELAWSYSCHSRNKIFEDDSDLPSMNYLECNGRIYDGGARSFPGPWIMGGNRNNPIYDDDSDESTTIEQQPLDRKWKPAGKSYDIDSSDSLQKDFEEWDRDSGTWSAVQQYGVNLSKAEGRPSVRSASSIGFGDSLHRELYRWANQGRGKNVRHCRVTQIERKNKINDMNGKEVSAERHHRISVPCVIVNQRPANTPIDEVNKRRMNQVNRISAKNVDEENATPRMNQKRMSLREIQVERQKRSGTGEFYHKNQAMFENYKRRVREGAAPEVLYFQY